MQEEQPGATAERRFLLEIWLERREIAGARPLLRGRLTDLTSQQSRAVKSGNDIVAFIDQSFDDSGAPPHRWQTES